MKKVVYDNTEAGADWSRAKQIELPYDFTPRDYQQPLGNYMRTTTKISKKFGTNRAGKRAVCVWHRRAGKDLTFINQMIPAMMERVGYYVYFFPTTTLGRRVIWDGMNRDGRKFLDYFPEDIIAIKNGKKAINDGQMKITLKNGSIFQIVGTDHIENVGINPVGCVFSEYSLQNPKAWDLIRPILRENGGWAIFNFTPRGKNHAYHLYRMAKTNPRWFCQLITVDDTGVVSEEDINEDRKEGMSEDLVQQEYYCSFLMGQEGFIYAKYMDAALLEGRITNVMYDPTALVHTAWDLGVSDATTLWFFQRCGTEKHFIDYYQARGEGMSHYADILTEKKKEFKYRYGTHLAPHDAAKRLLNENADTIADVAHKLGLDLTVVPQTASIQNDIEIVRGYLPMCFFDEVKCRKGIDAMEQYRFKFNEAYETYSNVPIHDWASHPCDGFRSAVMGDRHGLIGTAAGSLDLAAIKKMEEENRMPR